MPSCHERMASDVASALPIALASFPVSTGCSKDSGEKEPAVPVQVVAVEKTTLQHTVTAEAVLFPLQQAAITPKDQRSGKDFLRQARQQSARRAIAGRTGESRSGRGGAGKQRARTSRRRRRTKPPRLPICRRKFRRRSSTRKPPKQLLDAQQKVYDSRQELFQQGAMPRKELDQAGVDLTNARNQYEIAQKHLDACWRSASSRS